MSLNKFLENEKSKDFIRFDGAVRAQKQESLIANSQAVGELDDPILGAVYNGYFTGGTFDSTATTFYQIFDDKKTRIQQYRDMADYPEISCAIDMVCDEAITCDANGNQFEFDILNSKDMKRSEKKMLQDEFSVVTNELLNFKNMGWEIFRKFLVDAEVYFEVIVDKEGKDIIALKPLPAFTMTPIFEQGNIVKYAQTIAETGQTIYFEANQIIYINYGDYGANKLDVRGYLDSAITTYNRLRNLEDSAVIAQIVRAPQRRVFNIEVGQAPAGKADEIVRKAMQEYKKTLNYDPTTGLVDSATRFQAMTEDFWFARREGQGSTVETLQGGEQLEQLIELPNYFMRKMYKCLKIPSTRWGSSLNAGAEGNGGTYNNKMDIEREELNFTKFVERLQHRFVGLIEQIYLLELRFKKVDPRFLNKNNYNISMIPNNRYKEYRDMERTKEMLDMFSQYSDLIMSKDNPQAMFSKEFFMKYIVKMPKYLIDLNNDMKRHEQEELEEQNGASDEDEEGMMGGGSDFGGGFGGGGPDFGGEEMGGAPEGGAEGGEEPTPEAGTDVQV